MSVNKKSYLYNCFSLSALEIKVIWFLRKNNINYKDLEWIKGPKSLELYLQERVNNSLGVIDKYDYTFITDNDLKIIKLFKTYKLSVKKVLKILEKSARKKVNDEEIKNKIKGKVRIVRTVYVCLLLFFLSFGIVLLSSLYDWNLDNIKLKNLDNKIKKNVSVKEIKAEVKDTTSTENADDDYLKYADVSLIDVDFTKLLKINSDTKGWIKVEGTGINYPFVQASDNDYYLTHAFDKSYNEKGWVFMDYRNSMDNLDKNTILYAHGLVTNMMFGPLRKTVKSSWYNNKDNQVVKISTPTSNSLWQVFSTYTIDPETYYITTSFTDDDEYLKFLNTLKSRSIYNYGISLNSSDKIITLSSCYDNTKRVVLHAKLVSIAKR